MYSKNQKLAAVNKAVGADTLGRKVDVPQAITNWTF